MTIVQATAFELSENGEPVPVQASFLLLNISAIHDESETVEFSGVLKLVWQDKRQAFDPAKEGAREKVYSGNYQFNELSPSWYPQVTLVNAAGRYESRAVILRVKPDGTSTLTQAIDAVAKMNLDMRRYPFDSHRLEAVFGVLGFDGDEVRLETTPSSAVLPEQRITVPQWTLEGVESSTRKIEELISGQKYSRVSFIVTVDLKRKSFFMVRLVMFPLSLIVALSWVVFWMERSSLGDRMSVSFVGILTAVAYQMAVSGTMPQISYFTLMNAFLNVSFILMCCTPVLNLIVATADKRGDFQRGDKIDRCCRWLFPLIYLALVTALVVIAFFCF